MGLGIRCPLTALRQRHPKNYLGRSRPVEYHCRYPYSLPIRKKVNIGDTELLQEGTHCVKSHHLTIPAADLKKASSFFGQRSHDEDPGSRAAFVLNVWGYNRQETHVVREPSIRYVRSRNVRSIRNHICGHLEILTSCYAICAELVFSLVVVGLLP